MSWSNIDNAYKTQDFNSKQGKQFNKDKMIEMQNGTCNIMEGFTEARSRNQEQIYIKLGMTILKIIIIQIQIDLKIYL